MPKWIAVVVLTLTSIAALPATAGPKAERGSFVARAIPFPEMQADIYYPDKGSCLNGIAGVHKTSEPFEAPTRGSLRVRMQGLVGDWDLYVLSKDGKQLGASATAQVLDGADREETVTVGLKAKQQVEMVACNWLGEPQVTVGFAFSSKGP